MTRVRVFALSAALFVFSATGFAGVIGAGDGAVPTPSPTPVVVDPESGMAQPVGGDTETGEAGIPDALVSAAINAALTALAIF